MKVYSKETKQEVVLDKIQKVQFLVVVYITDSVIIKDKLVKLSYFKRFDFTEWETKLGIKFNIPTHLVNISKEELIREMIRLGNLFTRSSYEHWIIEEVIEEVFKKVVVEKVVVEKIAEEIVQVSDSDSDSEEIIIEEYIKNEIESLREKIYIKTRGMQGMRFNGTHLFYKDHLIYLEVTDELGSLTTINNFLEEWVDLTTDTPLLFINSKKEQKFIDRYRWIITFNEFHDRFELYYQKNSNLFHEGDLNSCIKYMRLFEKLVHNYDMSKLALMVQNKKHKAKLIEMCQDIKIKY